VPALRAGLDIGRPSNVVLIEEDGMLVRRVAAVSLVVAGIALMLACARRAGTIAQ
jgi:hypothetical protein